MSTDKGVVAEAKRKLSRLAGTIDPEPWQGMTESELLKGLVVRVQELEQQVSASRSEVAKNQATS